MDITEALKGITVHRKMIQDKKLWSNTLGLAEEILKISSYNSVLAENLAQLHYESTKTRLTAYKKARDEEKTQGDSDMESRWESLEVRREYENVNHIYKATDKFITVAQTQLKTIENQLKREGAGQI